MSMHVAKPVLLVVTLALPGSMTGALRASQRVANDATPQAARVDVRELLTAARGIAPTLCVLASDGAANGWWGGDGSDVSVEGRVRRMLRDLRSGALSNEETRALLDGLGSDDACVRQLAGTLIGRSSNKRFVPELETRLRASNVLERIQAARALGLLGERSSAAALVDVLHDNAAPMRATVAWALGRVGDRMAAPRVAELVTDSDADVRQSAVGALGHFQAADNVDILLRVLKNDESAEVRRTAAWALGEIGSRSAASGLAVALAGDKTAAVREMAVWALAELHGREQSDAIVRALRSDDSDMVRETAAWALGELDLKSTADELATALAKDRSTEVRGTSAWALGQIAPSPAPKALITALRDQDDDVRLKSAWALSEIRDGSAITEATTALRAERNERVRRALLRVLLRSGERSADAVRELIESKDKETREMAVRALAGHTTPSVWPWPWPRPRPFP